MGERNQARKPLLPLRFLPQDREGLLHGNSHQRRRRRRENEGAAAIDHEVAQNARRGDQGARRPQRLAACMDGDEVVASFVGSCQSAALFTVDPRSVGLVDHQERVVPVGDAQRPSSGAKSPSML